MPRIRNYSDGLFRRVNIIKLDRQFFGDYAAPHLIDKLRGELDAITSRALDNLCRLINPVGQFTEPQSSETAKATWRADKNHFEQFLSE